MTNTTDDLTLVVPAAIERREADRRMLAWVRSIIHKPCIEAARLAGAHRGDALLLWIDANGELQARKISREQSTLREFVPEFLQREVPR